MGMKVSAKASDYRKAVEQLESRGGFIEGGSLKGIIKSLGFDGGWKEFVHNTNVSVSRNELGRYCVSLIGNTEESAEEVVSKNIDPELFALCASAYVLGSGETDNFEEFHGDYESVPQLISALSTEIDESIGALYLPYKTEEDVEIYTVERSLFYTAPGDGSYRVYGSAVLANV
jgi:hypothetical protein